MIEQSSDIPFAVRVTPSPTLRLGMPMLWKLNRSCQDRISTGPELAVTGLQQKRRTMRYIYVLDMNGEPLMPTCRYGKVRRMLKSGQAKAVDTLPFTIQLLKPTKARILQPVIAGQDPGRTNIGMAAVRSDGTELYRAHIETRNKEIVSLMNDRRSFRQASRRGERLARKRLAKKLHTTARHLNGRILPGCKEPLAVKDIINTEARFNNRLRPEGWLTPTATQLLRTHLEAFRKLSGILPVTEVVLEVNRFAFMQLDNPNMEKRDIDFCRGPLYGTGGVKAAVSLQQDGLCLLCREREIEHYHHIVPRSRRGSNTISNIAGLCEKCHERVHKDQAAAEKLQSKKDGLSKKYGGTSVLNQIIPSLTEELGIRYPGHTHVTNGWNTKEFREKHELEKDHDIDAYCIAASILEDVQPVMQTEPYEIKQFRRHNRARIHCQKERTYRYDGKIVAKNRKKRMDQKTDSLENWVADMTEQFGQEAANRMLSKVTVQKSTRHYNTKGRMMPGTVFICRGKRFVMTGQLTGGAYYRAYGQDKKNFPAKAVQVIQKNKGLVYVA